MLGPIDTATITISINGLEIMALSKLAMVSHALADKIGGAAGREQKTLADTLDDVLRRITIQAAKVA